MGKKKKKDSVILTKKALTYVVTEMTKAKILTDRITKTRNSMLDFIKNPDSPLSPSSITDHLGDAVDSIQRATVDIKASMELEKDPIKQNRLLDVLIALRDAETLIDKAEGGIHTFDYPPTEEELKPTVTGTTNWQEMADKLKEANPDVEKVQKLRDQAVNSKEREEEVIMNIGSIPPVTAGL